MEDATREVAFRVRVSPPINFTPTLMSFNCGVPRSLIKLCNRKLIVLPTLHSF